MLSKTECIRVSRFIVSKPEGKKKNLDAFYLTNSSHLYRKVIGKNVIVDITIVVGKKTNQLERNNRIYNFK